METLLFAKPAISKKKALNYPTMQILVEWHFHILVLFKKSPLKLSTSPETYSLLDRSKGKLKQEIGVFPDLILIYIKSLFLLFSVIYYNVKYILFNVP